MIDWADYCDGRAVVPTFGLDGDVTLDLTYDGHPFRLTIERS